jgi:GcrA cell cycle regulator
MMQPTLWEAPGIIERLTRLWSEGHSTAEIGRRLGISKNAVAGKRQRLELPERPSPIKRDAPRKVRDWSKRSKSDVDRHGCLKAGKGLDIAPPPEPQLVAPSPPATPLWPGRVIPCCWPIGIPRARDFRLCEADSVPRKPYCAEHAQLAYVRVKEAA